MTIRSFFSAMPLLLVASSSVAAQQTPPPTAPEQLKLVAVYNGRWHSDDEAFDTPFSKAMREAVEIGNTCSANGEFYVCHQQVNKTSGPASAMVVFLWNAKERLFDTYVLDSSGGDAYHGHLTIDGDKYTWTAARPDPSHPNQWRTLNTFSGPDHIVYKLQVSSDGGAHWTTTRQGNESRVGK